MRSQTRASSQVSVAAPAKKPTTPADPSGELYVHESLLTWDGWSLSAPRPGKSISKDLRAPTPGAPETQPQRVENKALTSLPLETAFRVQDGTLPRLRFGHQYRFRVRAVDLAGNSPTLDEATQLLAALAGGKPPVFPGSESCCSAASSRSNPPSLLPRVEFTEGESLERLVIRSNFDRNTADYAAANPAYQPGNERHVVAPKAALQMVETHGLLDAALDAKPDQLPPGQAAAIRQQVYALAQREAGTLADTSLPSVRFVRTSDDPTSNDGYAVHTEEQLVLPYLPDAWAGASCCAACPASPTASRSKSGLAGRPGTKQRLSGSYHRGRRSPVWDDAARTLTVSLPQATVAQVRVQSLFGGDVEQLGLWQWLVEAVEKGTLAPQVLDKVGQA